MNTIKMQIIEKLTLGHKLSISATKLYTIYLRIKFGPNTRIKYTAARKIQTSLNLIACNYDWPPPVYADAMETKAQYVATSLNC